MDGLGCALISPPLCRYTRFVDQEVLLDVVFEEWERSQRRATDMLVALFEGESTSCWTRLPKAVLACTASQTYLAFDILSIAC
jgi:hypothetical protein